MIRVQTLTIWLSWTLVAGIFSALVAGQIGMIRVAESYDIALAFSEHPGVVLLSVMLLCSPLQKLTRQNWMGVRKHTGIVFGLLAIVNASMFYLTRSRFSTSDIFVAAALLATVACIPLLVTSIACVRNRMELASWKRLHNLAYLLPLLVGIHLLMNPSLPVGVSFTALLFACLVRFATLLDSVKVLRAVRS